MKKFLLVSAFFTGLLAAQIAVNFNPNTGDAALDLSLNSLNVTAKADLKTFTGDISATYKIEVPKIEALITTQKLEPAEIFLAAELAAIAKKPIDEVVKTYTANKAKGWGAVAKALNIKPGSPEFKALKGKADDKNAKAKAKKETKGKPAKK
ncbi:MAG: hypothetical protein HZC28_18220 [Spirochaetes bacterium]|nr:hypothetical protein [Spirochaetota bacterium]